MCAAALFLLRHVTSCGGQQHRCDGVPRQRSRTFVFLSDRLFMASLVRRVIVFLTTRAADLAATLSPPVVRSGRKDGWRCMSVDVKDCGKPKRWCSLQQGATPAERNAAA